MVDLRCRHAAWQFQSTARYPSSSETRFNVGIRRWKLHLPEPTWCQESIGGICFTNKLPATSLPPRLGFDNFKPRPLQKRFLVFLPPLKRSIFQCISCLNGSFFFSVFFPGWTLGFTEIGSQPLSNGTNVASLLANYFSVCYMLSNSLWEDNATLALLVFIHIRPRTLIVGSTMVDFPVPLMIRGFWIRRFSFQTFNSLILVRLKITESENFT